MHVVRHKRKNGWNQINDVIVFRLSYFCCYIQCLSRKQLKYHYLQITGHGSVIIHKRSIASLWHIVNRRYTVVHCGCLSHAVCCGGSVQWTAHSFMHGRLRGPLLGHIHVCRARCRHWKELCKKQCNSNCKFRYVNELSKYVELELSFSTPLYIFHIKLPILIEYYRFPFAPKALLFRSRWHTVPLLFPS